MAYNWEGNGGSDVTMAMHLRLCFIHLRAQGRRKRDKHPAYTPHVIWHSLRFIFTCGINALLSRCQKVLR